MLGYFFIPWGRLHLKFFFYRLIQPCCKALWEKPLFRWNELLSASVRHLTVEPYCGKVDVVWRWRLICPLVMSWAFSFKIIFYYSQLTINRTFSVNSSLREMALERHGAMTGNRIMVGEKVYTCMYKIHKSRKPFWDRRASVLFYFSANASCRVGYSLVTPNRTLSTKVSVLNFWYRIPSPFNALFFNYSNREDRRSSFPFATPPGKHYCLNILNKGSIF
jgi:hypothetical protein